MADDHDIRQAVRDLQGDAGMYGVSVQPDIFPDMMRAAERVADMTISVPSVTPVAIPVLLSSMSHAIPDDSGLEREDTDWIPIAAEPEPLEPKTDPMRPHMRPASEDVPHTLMTSTTHTDTTTGVPVKGDLIRSPSNGTWTAYAIGAETSILTSVSSLPVWTLPTSFSWYGKSKVSTDDTTPGYIEDKIINGNHTTVTTSAPGGDEKIQTDHNAPAATAATITIEGAGTVSGSAAITFDDYGHMNLEDCTFTLTGTEGSNNLLDGGTHHTDTASDCGAAGAIIVGNASANWARYGPCATDGAVLTSDGTKPIYSLPTGHSPWIGISGTSGVLGITHAGPGATCHYGAFCALGMIMDIDIDALGHVRYLQVCGYENYGDGCCVGPCGDSPT